MNLSAALNVISEDGRLFDIGQLSPEVRKALDKLTKKGILEKRIAFWPWVLTGTCKKTMWTRGQK